MAKKHLFSKNEEQMLIEIATLVKDPNSTQSDRILDSIAARYNKKAYEFIVAAGLVTHPKWPAWHRLLQTRFIESVCIDKPMVAKAIRKVLEGGKRPPIDFLMREVLRWCFIELKEWDKKKKSPKDVKHYWQEAFNTLGEDLTQQMKDGKTITDAPGEWYSVLGVDYSLLSVTN